MITDISGSNPSNTGNQSNQGNAVAIQPDGKILVGGCSECNNQVLPFGKFAVTRYLTDGSLDTSFGAGGHATVDVFPNREAVNDMVLQSDGKIVLVGGESDFGVVRLNSNGSLDTSFGTGGIVKTDLMTDSFDIPRAVALDSLGRIVVAGESRASLFAIPDFAIARYEPNGVLDTTFDADGKVFTDFALGDGSIPEERGKDVAIDANGKIVVVGNVRNPAPGAGDDFGVARYNDNGSLDTSFDVDGLWTVNLDANDSTSSVVVQTDGKIVVGGNTGGNIRDFALLRLNSSGTLDTTFDSDGIVRHSVIFGNSDSISALALQGDGKIVAAGVSQVPGVSSVFAVSRYKMDGSLDDDFDGDGIVTTDFGSTSDAGRDVAIQADGKIVVAGITAQTALNLDAAIARYEGGGAPPVAEAGGPYDVFEDSTVPLIGSATDDFPATLVYEWDLDGDSIFGETGAAALRGDEDVQNPVFSAVGLDGPGFVTVELRVTDECNLSHTDSATVNILNADPIANDDSAMTNEDQAVTIDVLANDSDPAGTALDPLEIVSATDGSKGTTAIDDKGTVDTTDDEIIYTPNPGETGLDTFMYAIRDGDGGADTATVTVSIKNLVDVSGRVYDDLDNDGVFEPGESGIAGVTIQVWDQAMTSQFGATTTAADGTYFLDVNLSPGTYKIVEVVDELAELGLLDGRETAGNIGGSVDNFQDSNEIANINVGAPGTTVDAVNYLFAEIRTSDITGLVWEDFNNDGLINFGELSVENAEVTLTGTDDHGNAVAAVADLTDMDGVYGFFNLRPGVYTLTQTQPAGLDDGIDSLGTVNGVLTGDDSVNDECSGVTLPEPNSSGEDYNFGERPTADGVVNGSSQTATIVFWKNKHGRELIESLNGGSSATQVGDWLAATFPNMYGASAGANDLTGKTNSEVAGFYKDLFKRNKKSAAGGGPPKMDAQLLATALAVYVSNETLAGTVAEDFGFDVTTNGVGVRAFNVGGSGDAFGVADGSDVTVIDLLLAVNARTTNGLLYDLNGDGDTEDTDETLFRTFANDVFSAINEAGDI